jgi:hypothetical protein
VRTGAAFYNPIFMVSANRINISKLECPEIYTTHKQEMICELVGIIDLSILRKCHEARMCCGVKIKTHFCAPFDI